jgi:hypothetical protein
MSICYRRRLEDFETAAHQGQELRWATLQRRDFDHHSSCARYQLGTANEAWIAAISHGRIMRKSETESIIPRSPNGAQSSCPKIAPKTGLITHNPFLVGSRFVNS